MESTSFSPAHPVNAAPLLAHPFVTASLRTMHCATASPYWRRHLADFFPRICAAAGGGEGEAGALEVFGASTQFPGIDRVELADLNALDKAARTAEIGNASMIVLFTQGNRLELSLKFIDEVAAEQSGRKDRIPFLIMAGLIGVEDLDDLISHCERAGLDAFFSSVSAMSDELTLKLLTTFITSPQGRPASAAKGSAASSAGSVATVASALGKFDLELAVLLDIEGAIGVALVDTTNARCLGMVGDVAGFEAAAPAVAESLSAMQRSFASGTPGEPVEDVLTTTLNQMHVMRPIAGNPALVIYLVLDRENSNLAMARMTVLDEQHLFLKQ
jgi:hypothetical protein